jgi:transposase InsO family protein
LAITICDPATGWFELAEIKDKTNTETAKILDQVWFCCYPPPLCCITDNRNEFLGTEFKELLRSYRIQPIHTTIKNSQANFVEHVHQTLGNLICTYRIENFEFDYNDP